VYVLVLLGLMRLRMVLRLIESDFSYYHAVIDGKRYLVENVVRYIFDP